VPFNDTMYINERKKQLKLHHNHHIESMPGTLFTSRHPSKAPRSDCAGRILDLPASPHRLSNLLLDMDHEQSKEQLHDWSTNWQTRTCTPGPFSSLPELTRLLQTISWHELECDTIEFAMLSKKS
jgi:hypothetical protein